MKKFTINSSSDNIKLSCLVNEPAQTPSSVMVLVHGMCEHKERYIPFMEFLAANGCKAYIMDNRGHGESVKAPADLGFMYEGGWRAMVEDLKLLVELARKQNPGLKLTLFGHSMGSMVVRSFTKRYDKLIDSLIVCGCPTYNSASGFGIFLAGFISLFRGSHYRPKSLQAASFGSYNKPFSNEKYHSAWVCSDKNILEQYHKDPLCQFVFTCNGFKNLLKLMRDCYDSHGYAAAHTEIPVRFISGADDPCKASELKLCEAALLLREAGYTDTDVRIYPAMRHEILNETKAPETVWKDILKFIA